MFLHILIHREFQSTPSAWRETTIATTQGTIDRDFNPLPPHGGRHCHACGLWLQRFYFNPLPPHGGRPWRNTANDRYQHFNPLPPHGGRLYLIYFVLSKTLFQSTPSAWRETTNDVLTFAPFSYFNPLPPHGGRRTVGCQPTA